MKVLKLTHLEGSNMGNPSCTYDATNCPALLEEINEMRYCEEGESWLITVGEMGEKEFAELPEFIGW